MTIKGDKVIGLKIVTLNSGKEIEHIRDIIYDPKLNKVRAFLVDKGGWFSDAKVLMIEDVNNIGEDAVIVESEDSIKSAKDISEKVACIAEEGHDLTRTKIITETGQELGRITDILFNSNTGEVEEFEISQGIVQNVKSGKKRVHIEDIITVGEEATIVRSFTEIAFEEQSHEGGLQGALETGKEKAGETWNTVKEKSGELSQKAQEVAQNAKDKVQEKANSPEVQEKKDQIVNKFHEVKDKVQSGELKDDIKEKASNFSDTVSQKADSAKENLESNDTLNNAKDKAKEALDSGKEKLNDAKDKVEEKKDEAQTKLEEKRTENALGKYLTVNILDENDMVVASRGELITNELINNARSKGLLEKVLDNNSEQLPE